MMPIAQAGRVFASLAILIPTSSLAQDCDRILDRALMNDSTIVDAESAAFAMASSFCDKSFEEAKNDGSFSAAAGQFGFWDADAEGSQSVYESFKKENCSALSSDQKSQRYYELAQRGLDGSAIEAWKECKVESTGLACFLRNAGGGSFVFSVRFRSPGTSYAEVLRSSISNGVNVSEPDLGSVLWEDGAPLSGSDDIVIERADEMRPLIITVKASYDGVSQSCVVDFLEKAVVLPSPPLNNRVGLTGAWCEEHWGGQPSRLFEIVGKDGQLSAKESVTIFPNIESIEAREWNIEVDNSDVRMTSVTELRPEYCQELLTSSGGNGEQVTCAGEMIWNFSSDGPERLEAQSWEMRIRGINSVNLGRLNSLVRC